MKKTFTANLNGTVFHIEEDAYDQLQRYLANIRAKFSGSAETEEIMADIEARIAELFTERLQGRQAVSMADVDHVKQVMGQPEDYVDDESAGTDPDKGDTNWQQTGPRRHKRLFRDPEDKKIAGVLSGLAHYFGTDPLWLRIIFLVLMLVGWGFPVILYIVLWILVPEAFTAAEKLEMQGEPVTVDNIKRMFDEGAERVKTGAEKVAGEAREMGRRYWRQGSAYRHEATYRAEGIAHRIFDAIGKLVGVLLLFMAIIMGLSVIVLVVTGTASWSTSGFTGGTGLMGLAGFIFPGAASSLGFALASAILLLVPVILLLLASLWLLFRVRSPRWAGWSLSLLFLLALATVTFIGIRLAYDFRKGGSELSSMAIPPPSNGVLHVRTTAGAQTTTSFSYSNWVARFDPDLLDIEGDTARLDIVNLRVETSPDSGFHLVTTRMARGVNERIANERAGRIATTYGLEDGVLRLSNRLFMPTRDNWRCQHVNHVLQVPIGGRIHFDPSAALLIHEWFDGGSDGDDLDRDMVGRTWTMTLDGLQAEPQPVRGAPAPDTGNEGDDAPPAVPPAPATLTAPHISASVQMPNLIDLLTRSLRP